MERKTVKRDEMMAEIRMALAVERRRREDDIRSVVLQYHEMLMKFVGNCPEIKAHTEAMRAFALAAVQQRVAGEHG